MTTRAEDRAYSLLGIFQVNMPMLYGEGGNAFIRLQEEIIKANPDMSIFAWTRSNEFDGDEQYSGLLASSPADFKNAESLIVAQDTVFDNRDYSITNRGLKFQIPLAMDPDTHCHILPINHRRSTSNTQEYSLGVYLRQIGLDLYVRALPHLLPEVRSRSAAKSLQVAKVLSANQVTAIREQVLYISRPVGLQYQDMRLSKIEPIGCWDPSRRMLFAGHTGVFLGFLHFVPDWADEFDSFVLVCRFDRTRDPPWRLDLVCGDDWRDIQPRYHDLYRYHHHAFLLPRSAVSLTLEHLYNESRKKEVVVSFVSNEPSPKETAYLSLDVVDFEGGLDYFA